LSSKVQGQKVQRFKVKSFNLPDFRQPAAGPWPLAAGLWLLVTGYELLSDCLLFSKQPEASSEKQKIFEPLNP
jgi:hypothetical protein